jgi:hypothetical protein
MIGNLQAGFSNHWKAVAAAFHAARVEKRHRMALLQGSRRESHSLRRCFNFLGPQGLAAGLAAVVVQFRMRQDEQELLPHRPRYATAGAVQLTRPEVFKLLLHGRRTYPRPRKWQDRTLSPLTLDTRHFRSHQMLGLSSPFGKTLTR